MKTKPPQRSPKHKIAMIQWYISVPPLLRTQNMMKRKNELLSWYRSYAKEQTNSIGKMAVDNLFI